METAERWRTEWVSTFGLGMVLLAGSIGPARAQQTLDTFITPNVFGAGADPGVTVLSRSRPEYDNGGIRAGSFIIRPQMTQSLGYESNVLGTPKPVGSSIAETTAQVSAASNWSRNSLSALVAVDNVRYLDQTQQSYTNWNANLGGTVEIGRDVLSLQYQHAQLNQTTRDLDVPTLVQPLSYNIDTAIATYRLNLNRVSITPGVSVSKYQYTNGMAGQTVLSNQGQTLGLGQSQTAILGQSQGLGQSQLLTQAYNQSFRDRIVVTPSVALGYAFSPRRSAVLVVRNGSAAYSNQQPGVGKRDYNDPAVLGGVDYDLTGLFRLRFLLGYEERIFVDPTIRTIRAPVIEATAIWTPTGLTTVTGTVSRHIQDTSDETIAAFTQTTLLLNVDHEYQRNILLRGTGGIYLGEYGQGGGDQALYAAGAGVTYLANRYAQMSATYDFQSRMYSGGTVVLGTTGQNVGGNYTDHRLMLQLRLGL